MKSNPLQWMPLYVADFLTDSIQMDAREFGWYMKLNLLQWHNGGPLLASAVQRVLNVNGGDVEALTRFLDVHFSTDGRHVWNEKLNKLYHARLRKYTDQVKRAKAARKAKAAADAQTPPLRISDIAETNRQRGSTFPDF